MRSAIRLRLKNVIAVRLLVIPNRDVSHLRGLLGTPTGGRPSGFLALEANTSG